MKRILLISFIIAYSLIFGEFFVRLLHPVPLMPRYVTGAPYGIRMNIPNSQYWQTTPETRVQLRINSQGIRADRDIPYQKPADQCRILLLGDSYFVGYEVDLQESFPFLLEQKLQQAHYRCEVINLAVSGFGTAEMLITLESVGLKYQPDIVILQWHNTDWDDNVRSNLYKLDKNQQLVRAVPDYLPAIKLSDWLMQFLVYRWLIENSQLYSAIRETAAENIKALLVTLQRTKDKKIVENQQDAPITPVNNNYPQRLSEKLLQAAQQLSQQNHAQFAVLEIPDRRSRVVFRSHLAKFPPELQKALNFWSPITTFEQAADPDKKIYFEKGHFHLTPWGNQLLTDYAWHELQKTGWLEKFKSQNN